MFVVVEDLVAEFVDKLIKTQVHFSLDLIVQKLFLKLMECVVSAVIVQVKGIEYKSENKQTHRITTQYYNSMELVHCSRVKSVIQSAFQTHH